jgi:hypothetical protein
MAAKKQEEDFLSSIERRAREALTVAKPTAGTVSGGLKKAVSNGLDAAGTVLSTPMKVVGGAVDSAIRGGSGAKGVLQKQANDLNKSSIAAGEGVDEASGNLKDDLSARAKGAATSGVGILRAEKGTAELVGNSALAPYEVLGDAMSSAVMGGEGAMGSAKRIGERLKGNIAEIGRGLGDAVEGGRQMIVGEKDPSGAAAPNPASMDPKSPSFVGPPEPARKSIDPKQDYGDAGPVPTDAKAEPINPDRMAALFKVANGGDFDPNSRMDRQKMAQLQMLIDKDPELAKKSDTKIAMQWYKTMK